MTGHSSKKKIAIALSGGIDSTAAAAMLKEQGHDVFGLHMSVPTANAAVLRKTAEGVARRLRIPFYAVDAKKPFTEEVIDYFIDGYRRGRTPNPCVVCNRQIKMGLLLQKALSLGAEKLATGHYARISYDEGTSRFILYKGRDRSKDQSYFLAMLRPEQLSRLLLPLGTMLKEEVKRYVQRLGLEGLTERESQEICFIPHGNYKEFLQERIKPDIANCGDIVDTEGHVLGRHQGIFNFTVGQRRGLGLPDATPFYVIGLNAAKKQVIIGKKEALSRQYCVVEDVNWISIPGIGKHLEVRTRIRYRHREAHSVLTSVNDTTVQVRFIEPQKAITPGQVAVFYEGETVVGGGFIV